MPYLIDGNNLIGHTPDLRLNDEKSRHVLVKRVVDFHRATGAQVIIVFDGESGLLVPDKLKLGGVRITYSGTRTDADSKIKSMVASSKNPREFIVVSSDSSVYNFAHQHGAQVMKCHQFNIKLNEHLNKLAEEKKPEVDDLEEWYRYFGIDDKEKDEG